MSRKILHEGKFDFYYNLIFFSLIFHFLSSPLYIIFFCFHLNQWGWFILWFISREFFHNGRKRREKRSFNKFYFTFFEAAEKKEAKSVDKNMRIAFLHIRIYIKSLGKRRRGSEKLKKKNLRIKFVFWGLSGYSNRCLEFLKLFLSKALGF